MASVRFAGLTYLPYYRSVRDLSQSVFPGALFLSILAIAGEMKGCTMAKGSDGKEMAVMSAGMKMGGKMGCVSKDGKYGVQERRWDDAQVTLLPLEEICPHCRAVYC